MNRYEKLKEHVFVTKLAGFEHSKYIQYNETAEKKHADDVPLVQGQNIRNGRFVEKYNYYISKKISDKLIRSKLNKSCILIPYVGSNLGEVGIFTHPYDCHMASNIAKIELKDEFFDIEYLKYYFQSPIGQKYLFLDKQGSAQPNITMESIRNTLVLYKPKIVQKKIAKVLSEIDKIIDNNTEINNNLEELMKAIYQRWFIEFEFPNEEGKPYKSNGGKFVYNKDLKQEIPEGWKVENCYKNELYNIIKPGVDKFDRKNYLATSNVNNSIITDGEWITYDNRESRANMQPQPYSIWFAKMKNSIKHITLPFDSQWFIDKYILSTGFLGIKCNNSSLSYLHCFIYSDYFEKVKDTLAHGATQEAINNEGLKSFRLLIPSNEILKSFEKIVYPLINQELNNIEENQKLTELKDFLLPLLMNGQINVDDIEI